MYASLTDTTDSAVGIYGEIFSQNPRIVQLKHSYILNTTQIRDNAGALITPGQPGWVYLPAVQYN
ncbi:MAG: hypothetical protein LBB94_03060, partial [Clostridiales bacterium]|nr:hypothetical protein [Clostridiales bacterium]